MSKYNIFPVVALLLCVPMLEILGKPPKDGPPGPPPGFLLEAVTSKEIIEECAKQVGLAKEELDQRVPNFEKELSEKELCFQRCIGIKGGVINENGKINGDVVKAILPDFIKDADTVIECLEKFDLVTCQDMKKLRECAPKPPKDD